MDDAAKRRLVGAAVLVALAVIFVPMLVDDTEDDGLGEPIVIPEDPDFDAGYDASSLPPEDSLNGALPTPEPPFGGAQTGEEFADAPGPEPAAEPPAADAAGAGRGRPADAGAQSAAEAAPEPAQSTSAPARQPQTELQTAGSAAGPKPVPDGVRAWVVQVASLGSPEAATSLQDELRGNGYPAFVEQATVRGKRYYRVRVGPEVERGRADALAERIATETGADPLVQRYP